MLADVTAAVTDLVARGIVHNAGRHATPTPDTKLVGASPLTDSDFPLGDEGMLAVQIGSEVIGLRSNDANVITLLRGALAPIVVTGFRAVRRLSLLAGPDHGRIAGLSFLYHDDELVFAVRPVVGPSTRRSLASTAFSPHPKAPFA